MDTLYKSTETNFKVVYLYSLDQQKSFPVSDGLSDASEPVFDPNGEYLYFFASTDAGPVVNWFDLSSQDMRMTNSIYLVTLQKGYYCLHLQKRVMKRQLKQKKLNLKSRLKRKRKKPKVLHRQRPEPAVIKIDTDGLRDRIVNIPVHCR